MDQHQHSKGTRVMDQDSEMLRSTADQLPTSQTSPAAKQSSSQPLTTVALPTQVSPGGSGSKTVHGSNVAYSPANYHAQQIQALNTMLAKQKQVTPPSLETKVKVHM